MNRMCNVSSLNCAVSGQHCARLSGTGYRAYESSVRFFSYWAFYFYSIFPQAEDAECAIAG